MVPSWVTATWYQLAASKAWVPVVGIAAVAETADAFGAGYGATQVVQALLTLGAVPLAIIAGRRQAAARQAES